MASYSVGIKRSAARELEALARDDRMRIIERIRALAADPRPRGCEKLSGEEKYRVRVRDLGVLYEVNDRLAAIAIVRIGHRRDVYR